MGETLTCGNCRHWRKTPTDANNLGAPPSGQCFEGPPQTNVLVVNMPGGQGLQTQVSYPPVPAQFPACDRFAVRIETLAALEK